MNIKLSLNFVAFSANVGDIYLFNIAMVFYSNDGQDVQFYVVKHGPN